jgi:hypothetical protein
VFLLLLSRMLSPNISHFAYLFLGCLQGGWARKPRSFYFETVRARSDLSVHPLKEFCNLRLRNVESFNEIDSPFDTAELWLLISQRRSCVSCLFTFLKHFVVFHNHHLLFSAIP